MIFYQRLRDVREDHDLGQMQIAEVLHTTQAQYSRWERGLYQMPVEHYKTLSTYYNITIDYLCGASSVALTQDYKPYMIGKK